MEIQQFKGSLKDLFDQVTNKEKLEQARLNRTMIKTINVLCFLPCYDGRFISSLISLNSDTVPLKEIVNESQRASEFMYSVQKVITNDDGNSSLLSWDAYYARWKSPLDLVNELYTSHDHSSVTVPIHPVEFYEHPVQSHDARTQINYMQVSLDPKDQYVIDRFTRYFAIERNDEEDALYKKFTEEYNPIIVSLSQIMKGETEFLEEYTKLCTAIDQQPHDGALELYRSWRTARKIDLFKL